MAGRIGDLTTLANVKAWRTPALVGTADDAQLQREITACSKFILNFMQRDLIPQTYVERRNGNGQSSIMLRNRPVFAVSSVQVGAVSVPAVNTANNQFYGFTFDNNPDPIYNTGMLYLNGYDLCRGQQNVTVTYEAGALISNEAVTLASGANPTLQCSALSELWSSPYSIAYASSGTLLTPVKANPTIGQYVPASAPDGQYQFSTDDASADLLVSYGFTPRDIEEATITTVILQYNRRSNIGTDSLSLAGETTSYTRRALNAAAEDFLRSYIEVTPIDP